MSTNWKVNVRLYAPRGLQLPRDMTAKPIVPDSRSTSMVSVDDTSRPRRLKLSDVLGDSREVIIEHDGQDYLLRITSKGKLILTK